MHCLAVTEHNSRGRKFYEPVHSYRNRFERDRDRIIHCSAFRRLEGKTQVFTPHVNDHYRTRLTHSVEVSQIGRTICRMLDLNEPLTEAICLAHDLGHSPFGHTGEGVLNEIMKDFGGFEHNAQTLRIVEQIERPYPDFSGLNLMYETRLGLAKHRSSYDFPSGGKFSERSCPLEGQIADVSDRIAYNCHDLEDGLRGRLFGLGDIMSLDICKAASERCHADRIAETFVCNTRIAKTVIDILVGDCILTSRELISSAGLSSVAQVYDRADYLIRLSDSADEQLHQLENFLLTNMYFNPKVKTFSDRVDGWLRDVFSRFCSSPELLPGYYRGLVEEFGLERTVCDYISGMTDWYCLSMADN